MLPRFAFVIAAAGPAACHRTRVPSHMDQSIAGLLVGRTLVGRYRIEEVIGRGGMSVVYRALDERLGRPVAVKVISFPAAHPEEQSELRERLRREAASAASIPPHPNVVQVYDYGSDPEVGVDFIAMELLPGRDVKALLAQSPPPIPVALRILTQAAAGVAAGHRVGIVHRDVKPSNIVVAGDDVEPLVKILDFGIAKALRVAEEDDLTRTGHLPHSPAYASPEQLRLDSSLTPASDVYQLGLVAYEMLAGARAYTRAEHERMREGMDVGLPARGEWGAVPPAVRRAVERALAFRPQDRYPDAEALCRALAQGEDEATVLLGDPPRGGSAVAPAANPRARRKFYALPRPALLAIAGVVALALLWLVGRPGDDSAPAATGALAPEQTADLDDEFLALRVEAAERLAESAPAGAIGAEGRPAAEEVDRVARDINRAWAEGDMERHASHYADRVDFYGSDLTREQVAQSRGESVVAYPQREIEVLRTAVTLPEPGRARVLIDKEWNFRGDGRRWVGSARQELWLELEDGRWRVVEERELEVFRNELD